MAGDAPWTAAASEGCSSSGGSEWTQATVEEDWAPLPFEPALFGTVAEERQKQLAGYGSQKEPPAETASERGTRPT